MVSSPMALAPRTMGRIGRFHPPLESAQKPRPVRQSLSFTPRCQLDLTHQVENSIYKDELEAAIEVVERACRLCISVRAGLRPNVPKHAQNMQFEKSDATPVTVADLGVQALVSLELGLRFPSMPLVGEEDSRLLREDLSSYQKKAHGTQDQPLVQIVTQAVASVTSTKLKSVSTECILNALDRGVKTTETESTRTAYWILDPIDGTRGFLRGGDALYVVGLALVVDGAVVLGVMGCPNVQFKYSDKFASGAAFSLEMAPSQESMKESTVECCEGVKPPPPRGFQSGLLMAACSGCGCWVRILARNPAIPDQDSRQSPFSGMIKCKVDGFKSTKEALFCISDHEEWRNLPLAQALASIAADEDRYLDNQTQILPLCCGSLCKYFAVALGGASVFVQHVQAASQVKVWDHAAGVICVVEAGGQVTDFEGAHFQKMLGNGQELVAPRGGILATNGSLHESILTILPPPGVSFS